MHDYAYYLGFTEANYNLQADNAGRGGVGGDPEVGNAQAGALTGGAPSYLGRDNANQITLQDGTPGITNQYLFQPIAGAFYAPCTDGGLDMGIVGHEYTHAISNRMVAGPDEGLTSEQGGAMGESWGDLVAGEYMFSHGYPNGGNPWAVGVYATGNTSVAIRDYAIDANPLNYSDYGFDSTGRRGARRRRDLERHQWSVRQALVTKYDAALPVRRQGGCSCECAQGTARRSARPADADALPGQPPLGAADVRLLPAPAGRDVDAGRPRRHARRGPDALLRRGRARHVACLRPARHGPGRRDAGRRLG